MAMIDRLMEQSRVLGDLLKRQNLTLALAESCTGGGLAYTITAIAGSSAYFDRGFVTYSNAAKQDMLAVSMDLLDHYGAVSQEVVTAMAEGALKFSRASLSLAITGIAGPEGGSVNKPACLVWFGIVSKFKPTQTICKQFAGNRQAVREQAIEFSLKILLKYIA